jgi:hypothetical protein
MWKICKWVSVSQNFNKNYTFLAFNLNHLNKNGVRTFILWKCLWPLFKWWNILRATHFFWYNCHITFLNLKIKLFSLYLLQVPRSSACTTIRASPVEIPTNQRLCAPMTTWPIRKGPIILHRRYSHAPRLIMANRGQRRVSVRQSLPPGVLASLNGFAVPWKTAWKATNASQFIVVTVDLVGYRKPYRRKIYI